VFDIEKYLQELIWRLKQTFGERLVYVGLQGSYLRGEATPASDIDVMVVIDQLGVADLDLYRSVLQATGHFDKSCGFICSKADLRNWNPLEICHLLRSTRDCFGELSKLVPVYTEHDVRSFVKLSVNNMYHEICHRYIHADADANIAALSGVYKGVFFILQNLYYLMHGVFVGSKAELLPLLDGKNYAVLQRSMALSRGEPCDFAESFALLFVWCQETMAAVS